MRSLNAVLMINGVSSAVTGLALVVFASAVAEVFYVGSSAPFVVTGVFLLVFGLMVFVESRRQSTSIPKLRLIIVLDVSWVIGSLIIVVFQLFTLSTWGYLVIGAVALWVALMAFMQISGLRQLIEAKS